MSKFITPQDYDASIHREILDALTRNDDAIIEICEDRAIAEMRGYLSGHYDCDKLFAATGDERNQLVLMMALDIAIYHIFTIHNPQKLSLVQYPQSSEDVADTQGSLRPCNGMAETGGDI